MDARDVCAIGDALAEGLDGTSHKIEAMTDAVARRSFAATGPARPLPQAIYDRITPRIYGAVRAVGPAAIRSGALGLGSALDAEGDRIQSGGRGKTVVSAVNGLVGDALARRGNGLALRMALRHGGRDLVLTEPALAAEFAQAGGRVAVFVHGFGESDDSWRWYSKPHWGASGISLGELLERDLQFVPLYLHYNSGRPLSTNAIELSARLEQLAVAWPGWVEEIVLVGHSAGASVAREALRHGAFTGTTWAGRVSHLFALGVPRHAQRGEHIARRASRLLGRLPETRPLSDLIEARSAGLKDLADEPGIGHLPDHVAVVALTSRDTGLGHFRLLNHPDVYRELRRRLSVRSAPARERAAREGRYGRAATALRGRRPFRRR